MQNKANKTNKNTPENGSIDAYKLNKFSTLFYMVGLTGLVSQPHFTSARF